MSAYSSIILDDSPIRYYRMHELSGTVIKDIGSQARDGTLNGTVLLGQTSLLNSDPDAAMIFDGTSGYISIPTTGLPVGASPFSLEFWFQVPTPPTGFQMPISLGIRTTGNEVNLYFQTDGTLCMELFNTTGFCGPIPDSNPHHTVLTYDGNLFTLYMDSAVQGTVVAAANLVYGAANIGAQASPINAFFPGALDEAAIYDYGLGPLDVYNHWLVGNEAPPYVIVGGGTPGITLAGQNITNNVDDLTVVIHDTLGQGPGAGSSGATQGRAATLKMNTNLGPMSNAIGAGQLIPSLTKQYSMRALEATIVTPNTASPSLVRQGEIVVTDFTGVRVFGGFATKYTDTTTSVLGNTLQNFTAVEAIDYSTSLQRTFVTEAYVAVTDVFIIRDIVNKYVPWVKLDFFPSVGTYTFARQGYNKQTVEQVFQTIAGITGYLIYVDYNKFLRYISPTSASSAPFNLSDQPDFITTFPHAVEEYVIDDNSVINRVFFHGGSRFSQDFTQDLSSQANGINTVFSLAYQPQVATDGTYTVKVGTATQVLGTIDGTGPANILISNGGLAQVLLDRGNQALTFDTAPPVGVVSMKYRYSFPLTIITTDEISHAFFGSPYLDGEIQDSTVDDPATAIQRNKVLLSQQSFGLVTLKVLIYRPGIQAGMLIRITNAIRGIDNTFLVQEVEIDPLGGGNFEYHLTLGAWNWNLIDFLLKLPTLSAFSDPNASATTSSGGAVSATQVLAHVQVHDVWSKRTSAGPYYARSAVVGDGSDSFPGFAVVTT